MLASEGCGERAGDDVQIQIERVDLEKGQPGVMGHRLSDLDIAQETELLDDIRLSARVELDGPPDLFDLLGVQGPVFGQNLQEIGDGGGGCRGGGASGSHARF